MPSDFALKAMNRVHRMVLGGTGGRFGWKASGMPVIELTTTGRRSGQPRATMLTSPYQEGFDRRHCRVTRRRRPPSTWYLNLKEHPEVVVVVGGKPPQQMRAEIANPEDRARLSPLITATHTNYAGYQRKTKRKIPFVLLRPIDA